LVTIGLGSQLDGIATWLAVNQSLIATLKLNARIQYSSKRITNTSKISAEAKLEIVPPSSDAYRD
jgi:hypothetical protein